MSMHFENPLQMLRLLKGAPLSVIFALFLAKQTQAGAVGQEWIERNTGYTDKPVSQALALLEEYGLVSRNTRYGWALTGAAMQLPLMGEMLEAGGNNEAAALVEEGSRKISESEKFRLPLASSINPETREEEELPPDSRAAGESENLRVVEALEAHGIREPARSRLAGLGHVTVEMIRYHCQTSASTGQAIYRIENNWPVKESPGLYVPVDPPEGEAAAVAAADVPADDLQHWERAKGEVQRSMSQADYHTWVACSQLVGVEDGGGTGVPCYRVGTGNQFGREWLESHAGGALGEALERITGAPARIEFVIWQV